MMYLLALLSNSDHCQCGMAYRGTYCATTVAGRTRPPALDLRAGRGGGGWVEGRVEIASTAENGRISRGGDGVQFFGSTGFFMEPTAGIEPATC